MGQQNLLPIPRSYDNLCHHPPITSLSIASSSRSHHLLSNYWVRKMSCERELWSLLLGLHLQTGRSHQRSQPDFWSLERAPCSLANTAKLLMELQKFLNDSLEAFLTSFLYLRWACIKFPALRFSFVRLLLEGHLPLFLRDCKVDVHFRECLFPLTTLRGPLSL
jgi:uncharacterized protein VirK/YbjX